MSLPSTRAGPNQVREYLAHILHSKHDVPLSTAHKIANKWQLGRPNDLRQEGVDYFKQVFGTDAGRFLFRTVQEDIEAEWRESTIGVITYWTNIFSIVLSVFFVVRAFCRSEEKGIMGKDL
ncbi:hypothetical protein PHISCL_09468 [Aspergillus sclerotialis]|uniref:Uncharacterized protein n=1 Tax=Aspergillus sclerotialis TaxID=2070753 RepID=A0A3A2ZA86_9EURO|nr:hypothetical protein PHISCL_09468 [Aspergillus sclerotialis]